MNKEAPVFYDKETIDRLVWPSSDFYDKAKSFLPEMIKKGTSHFFSNVQAELQALAVDNTVLPITICEPSKTNSYVCSFYSHFVTYGQEELKHLENKALRLVLQGFLKMFGKLLLSCDVDKNVIVNNWLLPTNLHPSLTFGQVKAVTDAIVAKYPSHAVVFRTVNPRQPEGFLEILKTLGYSLVPSREVYFTDTKQDNPFSSRMFKSDIKIRESTPYKATAELSSLENSLERIKDLYFSLNIEKYSACNPQYTKHFIETAMRSGWMQFKGFEKEGSLDAVFGYFSFGEVMTSPFFGYDTKKTNEAGLYRLIATELLLDCHKQNKLLHQSSGAGHYKKLRRAKEAIEYTAVYHRHLNAKRRLSWVALENLMDKFGKKFMKDV